MIQFLTRHLSSIFWFGAFGLPVIVTAVLIRLEMAHIL